MTRDEFVERYAAAPEGARIVYWTGSSLAADRQVHNQTEELARAVFRLAAAGRADLLQRRVDDENFAYIIVKRSAPDRRPTTPMRDNRDYKIKEAA
jgi:hypothetical protein